ncbi:hypothetical protein AK812_SmicGene21635 [Symbiodinium microadriaticum]|uniref:Uncharacterized protein n=1 Tax=Symbiodinium microadriaticum TaxID=2951 RepID=A0A1Q9DLY0_SYMMI|nr:hypothetical protein AK812_SmicGene21635 [Symbiodinium microadriaticum]CAE7552988.1 unnamed protein product [Symbiodinium sp. KB8]
MDIPPKWNFADAGIRKNRVDHDRLRLLQVPKYSCVYLPKHKVGEYVENDVNFDFLLGFLACFAANMPTQGEMMVLLAGLIDENGQRLKKKTSSSKKVASKNPDEMETQIEGDPPPSEHEGGEEEKKTDDEEVLPHHGDEPFCNDGTMDDEESKQKEGAEEEEKETDPIVYPDEETENEAEDDEYVGDEKIRKEKEGGKVVPGCSVPGQS